MGHIKSLDHHKVPKIYLNDGQGQITKMANALHGTKQATRPAYALWGLTVVVDVDNDGIADILWNGRHFLRVLRGSGDGHVEYMNNAWDIKDTSAAAVDDGLGKRPEVDVSVEFYPSGELVRRKGVRSETNVAIVEPLLR